MRPARLLLLLCGYTAMITFKPSEPFLVKFLEDNKNISHTDVLHEIFPVWSYAYLALLPVLCAAAELVGHRRIVFLGVICRIATTLLLLWPSTDGSVALMQLSQVTIAVAFAAHPAFSAIMYRGLPREAYVRAVGIIVIVGVVSDVSASLLGQLLTQLSVQLTVLFSFSVIFSAAALLFVCFLPTRQPDPGFSSSATSPARQAQARKPFLESPMPPSIGQRSATADASINYLAEPGPLQQWVAQATAGASGEPSFDPAAVNGAAASGAAAHGAAASCGGGASYRADAAGASADTSSQAAPLACCGGCCSSLRSSMRRARLVWSDTAHLLRHSGAMYYYAWLSVATAVHHLVVTYWQASKCLSAKKSYNGYIQAVASLLGGAVALLPMLGERCIRAEGCARLREGLLVLGPLALAGTLYSMSFCVRAELYAAGYIVFHVGFECLRVVCEAEGARCVAATRCEGAPRFAAVSGLNTTLSLGLQVLLQLLFDKPRRLPLEEQFALLSAMLLALFGAYASVAVWKRACARRAAAEPAGSEGSAAIAGAEDWGAPDAPAPRSYQRYNGV